MARQAGALSTNGERTAAGCRFKLSVLSWREEGLCSPAGHKARHSQRAQIWPSSGLERSDVLTRVRLRSSPAVPRDGCPAAQPSPRSSYALPCIMRAGEARLGRARLVSPGVEELRRPFFFLQEQDTARPTGKTRRRFHLTTSPPSPRNGTHHMSDMT